MSAPTSRPAHLPLAELALAGVTLAVIFGFARLFQGWSFSWPLVAVGAYAHLATMALRRRGAGVATSAVVSLAGFLLLAGAIWFTETTTFLLPTTRTVDVVSAELRESWAAFQQLTAPVPGRSGFLLACGLAIFVAVFLADWAAFRLWSPIEAIVPATTLFVFGTLLGADQQRTTSAVAFGFAVLLFVLAHRVARLERRAGWVTSDDDRSSRWLLRSGGALAAAAVVAGVVIGPRLPGATAPALIDWRAGDGGPSSRVTVSPLVDIRQRLVDQHDLVVFAVEADRKAYWRLTSLDTFDGQIWRSGGRYREASGDLPAQLPAEVTSAPVRQRFSILGLSALWLPAAYQPVAVDAEARVRYQPDSATLIVDTAYPSSDDLRYEVVSEIPEPTPEQLDRPAEPIPAELAGYLELPSGFSRKAQRLASEAVATAGATTPYQQAMALQAFFREEGVFATDDHRFVYDLSPAPGHGDDAIDAFLDSGRGYCEQFAGTYAAMARSVGLPARVAVGFTWGEQDPSNPNLYLVRGRFAHAWPEVWLGEQVGWVAFEPTPGRGAPGMDYAGIRPAQADGERSEPTTSTTAPVATTDPTTPQVSQPGDRLSPEDLAALQQPGSSKSPSPSDPSPWTEPLAYARHQPVRAALALAVLTGLYAIGMAGAAALRRRWRRAAARDPNARVRLAWRDLTVHLRRLGIVRRPAETANEFATRAAAALPEHATAIVALAADADAATFSTLALDQSHPERAELLVAELARTVSRRLPRHRLLLDRLDPRLALRS
ncbi:transglutaminase TgpA family protein [Rhabdothermincola sediminis]|uniref:transglutaminase TgpA family protein n=1 Tax=Rhabdothermincola sediminis TaxID=2751370 RepID=UPI001AA06560|nr:DUF3488 and transglutaminase-like domain-containing protein [Rhabdothermincola sediminis]